MEDLNTESLPHHSAEARKPSVRGPASRWIAEHSSAGRRAARPHCKSTRRDGPSQTGNCVAPRPASATGRLQGNNCCLPGVDTFRRHPRDQPRAVTLQRIRGQGVASDRGIFGGIHACCSIRTPDRPGGSPRRMRGARRFRGARSLCRPAGETTARSRSTMWCSTTIRITSLTLAASFRSTSTASIRVTFANVTFRLHPPTAIARSYWRTRCSLARMTTLVAAVKMVWMLSRLTPSTLRD